MNAGKFAVERKPLVTSLCPSVCPRVSQWGWIFVNFYIETFSPMREAVMECCTTSSFTICATRQVDSGSSNEQRWGRRGLWHVWKISEMDTNLKARGVSEDCVNLAQIRDERRASMNLGVPSPAAILFLKKTLLHDFNIILTYQRVYPNLCTEQFPLQFSLHHTPTLLTSALLYFSEVSHPVPARPSGKGRSETWQSFLNWRR